MPKPDFKLQSTRYRRILRKLEECKIDISAMASDYEADNKMKHCELLFLFHQSLEMFETALQDFATAMISEKHAEAMLATFTGSLQEVIEDKQIMDEINVDKDK